MLNDHINDYKLTIIINATKESLVQDATNTYNKVNLTN